MSITTIFSIGHGSKSMEDFIHELNAFNIEYLADIRSKPYSKWYPHFNQSSLKCKMKQVGIHFIYMGDSLGGLPEDRSCYDSNGKVVYDLIKEKLFFRNGLQRLITANEKAVNLAIMCSEAKPEECHRSKLIGQELLNYDISIKHIISAEKMITQEEVINNLTKGLGLIDLFGNKVELTSVKSY
ncbi:DUF488 domain-containing protein [Bacteroides sp. OttesenSCG-928-D19]|nr:DUF488 domain-containing protein [Bacteroides sp. OttesenSCG-928-D19]